MTSLINETNFYKDTLGRFTECDIPSIEPNYVSKTMDGKVSSKYYYTKEGVIRVSNHWGSVASCQWNLNTINEFGMDKCRKTEVKAGFITFNELSENHKIREELMVAYSKNNKEKCEELREKLFNKF